MSKGSGLVVIGVLTLLLPISGLPASVSNWLLVLFGAIVIGIGASLRMRKRVEVAAPPQAPEPAPIISHEPQISSIA